MYNLTSITDSTASAICQLELSRAGIPQIYQGAKSIGEVQSDVSGILYFASKDVTVSFVRAECYWSVQLSKPLPHFQASLLNYKWQNEVRVNGQAGGGNPPKAGVSRYSVDSQKGLNALVHSLRSYFGETANLAKQYTVLDDPSLDEEIHALIGLGAEYGTQDESEQDHNLAVKVLLEALAKAEDAQLQEQLSVAVFVLLKLHSRWAEEAYSNFLVYGQLYNKLTHLNHLLMVQKLAAFCWENQRYVEEGLGSSTRRKSFQRLLPSESSDTLQAELKDASTSMLAEIEQNQAKVNLSTADRVCIVINTLILVRIYDELGEHALALPFMLHARTINEMLPAADRQNKRFPEAAEWNRFKAGSLAHTVHNTTLFSYPH